MYNNIFPMSYANPYYYQQAPNYQPVIQNQNQNNNPQPQNGGLFYFVNSQKEAEDWIVGTGQTVFFFDRNNSVFYIKSVAQNGLSQPIEVYDYSQRTSVNTQEAQEGALDTKLNNYITKDEFEALRAQVESLKKLSSSKKKEAIIDE